MTHLDELVQLIAGHSDRLPELSDAQTRALARHLELVLETNQQFNLTAITDPAEAVVKHIVDSLAPHAQFAGAATVLDLGSGAGYPGIPLAIALPHLHVTLAESTQKKARFLQSAVDDLGLENVTVRPERGEQVLREHAFDVVTARAVGAIHKLLPLLWPGRKHLRKVLLYKGQKAAQEMADAATEAKKLRLTGRIAGEYELPGDAGRHCIVEYLRGAKPA